MTAGRMGASLVLGVSTARVAAALAAYVASSIAHDFNNALQAIQLATESIEDSDAIRETRDEVTIIRDAARSGSSLAREIIEFSRPNVDSGELADVADALRSLEWMRHQLAQRRIDYDVRMPVGGLQVRLGATRLEQVLSNLICNAPDAVSDGGRISVTAERRWIDEGRAAATLGLTSGPYVQLSVSDNGSGIADDVKQRMFEPYFTTKADSRGTGLGLATIYNLVRCAGGTVSVSSRVGAGATFDVLLPVGD